MGIALFPGNVASAPPLENRPPNPAQYTEPIEIPEPPQAKSFCNCYDLLKVRYADVPSMASLQLQAGIAFGNVAVFWYGPSARYPNGTGHVAIPTGKQDYGKFEVEEYNFEGPDGCTHSYRWVSFADPNLIGFVTL